jgi:hypothetical protein
MRKFIGRAFHVLGRAVDLLFFSMRVLMGGTAMIVGIMLLRLSDSALGRFMADFEAGERAHDPDGAFPPLQAGHAQILETFPMTARDWLLVLIGVGIVLLIWGVSGFRAWFRRAATLENLKGE